MCIRRRSYDVDARDAGGCACGEEKEDAHVSISLFQPDLKCTTWTRNFRPELGFVLPQVPVGGALYYITV